MIEPSYSRAFEFVAANSRRRSLVVILTDLVDEEGSRELLRPLAENFCVHAIFPSW